MVVSVEYMYEDVSAVELGRLGELITSLQQQGWQPLEQSEMQFVPQMLGVDGNDACLLWMKRRADYPMRAAAA
ncbi:hypothetical protein KDL29_13185 [bacterium]|nr:hypothetical protein [bacterium]MCB1222072.1 hypothetical protein [bacterium]UNM07089.1 MAG: hypothetical protein H7A35_09380 [Planctomycetales bacterium]